MNEDTNDVVLVEDLLNHLEENGIDTSKIIVEDSDELIRLKLEEAEGNK